MPTEKQAKRKPPPTPRTRTGGRESQFTFEQLIEHGIKIGLADLSIQSVATSLGVTPAAVYRRVKSRLELETLIGEAILSAWVIHDEAPHTATQHLVNFGVQLRALCLAHPGTARYMQHEFPRGSAGLALLTAEVNALVKRGYDAEGGIVLSGAIASITVGQVIGEENRAQHFLQHERQPPDPATADPSSIVAQDADLRLADAHLPRVAYDQYFHLLISAVADGLVANLPPTTDTAQWIRHRLDTLEGNT